MLPHPSTPGETYRVRADGLEKCSTNLRAGKTRGWFAQKQLGKDSCEVTPSRLGTVASALQYEGPYNMTSIQMHYMLLFVLHTTVSYPFFCSRQPGKFASCTAFETIWVPWQNPSSPCEVRSVRSTSKAKKKRKRRCPRLLCQWRRTQVLYFRPGQIWARPCKMAQYESVCRRSTGIILTSFSIRDSGTLGQGGKNVLMVFS